eukprot:TRINITY_DN12371_c0_g1_i6.p1 TRINITY_DN12371_c0_g1~~TRINITY_DN12371_c0_g1_i6.p1  ORF type:complete len:597 (-),score=103.26 TRINITY_DN12371_c0_g1_i6:413-2203(-)
MLPDPGIVHLQGSDDAEWMVPDISSSGQNLNGKPAFKVLLSRLSEQYERDLAQAALRARSSFVQAEDETADRPRSSTFSRQVSARTEAPNDDVDTLEAPNRVPYPDKPEPSPPIETRERGSFFAWSNPELDAEISGKQQIKKAVSRSSWSFLRGSQQKGEVKLISESSHRERDRLLRQKSSVTKENAVRRLVRSRGFAHMTAIVLLVNAIFIGVQVQSSFQNEKLEELIIIDWAFCVVFVIEILLRLYDCGFWNFWTNPRDRWWNAFDFFIVVLSTVDAIMSASAPQEASSFLDNITVLRVTRVVRIVRVLRVVRVLKFFQDLRILLSAILSTVKTASFALMLIVLIIYIFAIAIAQQSAEHIKGVKKTGTPLDEEMKFYFGSLGSSMLTLYMTIAGGIDWKDALVPLFQVSELATFLFLAYVSLMMLCIMNVLFGIFCQCALDAAANDKDGQIQAHMAQRDKFVHELSALFLGWDDTGDGKCTLEEFENHLYDEDTQALLRQLEIPSRDAMTLFELLDADQSGQVDLSEFVTGCITLRGGAKSIQMGVLSRNIGQRVGTIEEDLKRHERKLDLLVAKLAGKQAGLVAKGLVAKDA